MRRVEKMARSAEFYVVTANQGYGQDIRWTFPKYDPETGEGDTVTPGSCDCSSLMYFCAKLAGFNVPLSGNTRTMRRDFAAAGFSVIPWDSIGDTSNLRRGDILLRDSESGHTGLWTGKAIAEAYENEKGGIKGGQLGDQFNDTDHGETRISPWRYANWNYVLRYPEGWPNDTDDDCIVSEEAEGVFDSPQSEYAYRLIKYKSGMARLIIRDYFNPAAEQLYGEHWMLKNAKHLAYPVTFRELPHISQPAIIAPYNAPTAHIMAEQRTGFDFYVLAPVHGIPRFSMSVEVVGELE